MSKKDRKAKDIGKTTTNDFGTGPAAFSKADEIIKEIKKDKELNKLVSAYAQKKGAPHANVHMDLRRACGGPELASATSEEVTERIETIRRWFVGRR